MSPLWLHHETGAIIAKDGTLCTSAEYPCGPCRNFLDQYVFSSTIHLVTNSGQWPANEESREYRIMMSRAQEDDACSNDFVLYKEPDPCYCEWKTDAAEVESDGLACTGLSGSVISYKYRINYDDGATSNWFTLGVYQGDLWIERWVAPSTGGFTFQAETVHVNEGDVVWLCSMIGAAVRAQWRKTVNDDTAAGTYTVTSGETFQLPTITIS